MLAVLPNEINQDGFKIAVPQTAVRTTKHCLRRSASRGRVTQDFQ